MTQMIEMLHLQHTVDAQWFKFYLHNVRVFSLKSKWMVKLKKK